MKASSKKDLKKENLGLEINSDYCKGCGICVAFCPKGVLELNDHQKAVVKDPDQCNGCGLCELRCPDMAIEVTTA
ncbi:MAG: 4Fe-4S binding protein [Pseudomonadota bacterium]